MSDTGLTVPDMIEPPRRYDVTVTVDRGWWPSSEPRRLQFSHKVRVDSFKGTLAISLWHWWWHWCVLSRLMPPPQGRSRSVRSSDTRACAGVRLVSSRGGALRHTREGDEKDVRDRAGVEDVIHFARSLDERLPRAVRGDLALGADR